MRDYATCHQALEEKGFAAPENVFTDTETAAIVSAIEKAYTSRPTLRKTRDLFAIRQFVREVPKMFPYLLTERLQVLGRAVMGADYFLVKSIYFDKPGSSNWFLAYHQDLAISVDRG